MEKWIYFFFSSISLRRYCGCFLRKEILIVDLLVQIGKFEMEWQTHKASKKPNKNSINLSWWNNGKLLLPWFPSWCKFFRMRFARTPPGRNYNRWKRCPEQSCQVFGKWLSGPRNSAQLGSTSRSNNRNHIFESSPGCLRLCSKILSSSLARSRSILCGRPPLTPLNSTLCMTKKKGEEKKEKREKKGKKMYYVRQEKTGKNNKTGRTHRLVYEAKNSFFFVFFIGQRHGKKILSPARFAETFFFFPRVPWIGIESSMRVPICMHRFFYTRTCQKIPLSILTIFFFFLHPFNPYFRFS